MVFLRWQYDEGYNKITNRVYRTTGRLYPFAPPKYIDVEERHEYIVKFNVSIYFCDSPDLERWIVRRKIYGIVVIEVLDHEFEGGLDNWVEHRTHNIARRYRDSSWQELGYSMVFCSCPGLGGEAFKIEVIGEPEYKGPEKKKKVVRIPEYILDEIKYLENRKERAETKELKEVIQIEIDAVKRRYGIE